MVRLENINRSSMKVQFIGLGYIGLPTAALIASKKIKVIGVDINPKVVDTINNGEIHIVEPFLSDMVKEAVNQKYLTAQIQPTESDVHIIVVPTPFKKNHRADISFVETATLSVIPHLKKGDLFIIESTSPIGTTEKMANLIFKKRPDLIDELYIAYCPERVLPGNVLYELTHNDRVIGGINDASTQKAIKFYSMFVEGQLHSTDTKTAEMCKLTENSSRDVQIAFANELSIICDRAGIDVWELIKMANKHPRVKILQPGSGVGGHCIAIDPWFIVSDFPEQTHLIKAARDLNDYKADWCANKVIEACVAFEKNRNTIPVVACMGLAFKPNIDDLRESPAKYITARIISETNADVLVCEPNISEHKTYNLHTVDEAYKKADIVVWLVKHDSFLKFDKGLNKLEFDFCGVNA